MNEKKAIEKLEKQYKRQNEYNKNNYYRASVLLPKGTDERIKAVSDKSINEYIKSLILADLERLESKQALQISQNTKDKPEEPDIYSKSRDEILASLTPEQRKKDEENRKRVLQQLADIEFGKQQRASKTE